MRKAALICAFLSIIVQNSIGATASIGKVVELPMIGFWLLAFICGAKGKKFVAFHYVMIAFMLWSCLTYYWSFSPDDTTFYITRYISFGLFSCVLWNLVRTEADSDATIMSFLIGNYILVGLAIRSFQSGVSFEGGDRFSAAGWDPNDMAFELALGIPLAWSLAINSKNVNWFYRALSYGYPVAALIGILVTASRGGLIDALPGFIYIALTFRRTNIYIKMLGTLAAFAVIVFALTSNTFQAQISRLSSLGSSASSDRLSGRLDVWAAAWDLYTKHPVLGIGLGSMPEATRNYAIPKNPETGAGLLAHNTYLEVLTETGVPGILMLAFLLYLGVRAVIEAPKLTRAPWAAALIIFLVGIYSLSFEIRWPMWIFFSILISDCYVKRTQAISMARSDSEVNLPPVIAPAFQGKPSALHP